MIILVTGGAGFIGGALCRFLIKQTPYRVINVDKLSYAGSPTSVESIADCTRYQFYHVDICDSASVRAILHREQPDAILHLAAETHVDRSITDPSKLVTNNIVGTFSLLESARRYWESLLYSRYNRFRFLHVSTDEVFGSLGSEGIFTEHSCYHPSSPYAASKASADHLVRSYFHTYGLPTLISSSSNNFGPYQHPEKLIPLTITRAIRNRDIPVYGDGRQVRDWLFVEDHISAILRVLERGNLGHSYLVSSRTERSNIATIHAVCDALDEACPGGDGSYRNLVKFVADRPGHDFRYALDPSKLERELGWVPMHSFDKALQTTVQWYLNNRAWWTALLRADHQDRSPTLPLSRSN